MDSTHPGQAERLAAESQGGNRWLNPTKLFWFMTQVQYAVEDFLERPGDDRKANLVEKLVEYHEAVRLGMARYRR